MTMRVFSFGGGIQSTAVLVLIAQKRLQYDALLFANVGDDSEAPEALEYIREVSWPYAERHGINLIEVQATQGTLMEAIKRRKRSVPIPMRLGTGAPGRRGCTTDFKIRPIARWLKRHGATAADPAVVGLGISTDEIQRSRTHSGFDWETLEYPLLDLRMSRNDCRRIITDAGLPIPPKSACWFCPFTSKPRWVRMQTQDPERFAACVAVEKLLSERQTSRGKDAVYLTNWLKPLDQAVSGNQLDMFDEEPGCDSGHCFT